MAYSQYDLCHGQSRRSGLCLSMKPSIPDTGTVIRLEGEYAVVRMKVEGSCWKCGAAAIGLCKVGIMQVLTVRNPQRARVGDPVRIGLVDRVQYAGYVLAYVVPALALVLGSIAGHYLAEFVRFRPLDIITGLSSLVVFSSFSFRRLKRLDSAHSIEIVNVLLDPWESGQMDRGFLPPKC